MYNGSTLVNSLMPRFGRRNRRKTYSIPNTRSGFRTISDVQTRLRIIKKRCKIDEALPGILFREVQSIFRSFGWDIAIIRIFIAQNYLDDGTRKGRKFIAIRENGFTEEMSVGEFIKKSRYLR